MSPNMSLLISTSGNKDMRIFSTDDVLPMKNIVICSVVVSNNAGLTPLTKMEHCRVA